MNSKEFRAHVRVPMNIAFIKYWGKADEDEIVPLNDSISVTLNDLYADTQVYLDTSPPRDKVYVNRVEQNSTVGSRFAKVFQEFRKLCPFVEENDYKVVAISTASFPVRAGLASSAAGFAAIAIALGIIGQLSDAQVKRLARIGSGSACRSLFPGFAHWNASLTGVEDAFVSELTFGEPFIRSLVAFVLLIDEGQKEVGSTIGMKRTIETSQLFKQRLETVVPQHIERFFHAIEAGDFAEFANVMMLESNSLHAVCLDSFPPLNYLNESSFKVISAVHELNAAGVPAGYTFDAGPNAIVFVQETELPAFVKQFKPFDGKTILDYSSTDSSLAKHLPEQNNQGDLKRVRVIATRVGKGPQVF